MINTNKTDRYPFFNSGIFYGCMLVLFLGLVPVIFSNPYFLRMAILTFIFSILTMSLSLLLDFTGIISLGHGAFFGIGAYTTGILCTKMESPFLLSLPISGVVAIIVAIAFGALTFRTLKGLYFTLASWAMGEIAVSIYMNVEYLGGTNGIRAIPLPSIMGFTISSDISFYYFTLIFAILTLISIELIVLSRIGRAFIGIREEPVVAGVMGVNVYLFQILSFATAAFYAGMAGNLYAYYESFISPKSFTVWESIFLLCMVIVGGRRSIIGSVVGAAIFTFLPELLRVVGEYREIIYGCILLATILFRPTGLIPAYHFLSRRTYYNGHTTS